MNELREAPPQPAQPLTSSFYYGAPVSNVIFVTDAPHTAVTLAATNPGEPFAGTPTARSFPSRTDLPLFRIDRWNREEGLPANKVSALLQSRDGYLWMGTVGGVARFDGVRFTVFNDANTAEMRMNGSVGRTLFEDEQGRIWIGTERGLLCFTGGRFVPFAGQDVVRHHDVRCLSRRSTGGFWLGGESRVGRWDGSGFKWETRIEFGNDSRNRIMALAEHPAGTLWIGTVGGLWKADLMTGALARILPRGDEPLGINGLYVDRRGTMWIGSSHGVWRWPRGVPEPVPIGDPEPPLRALPHAASFAEDAAGDIWATTAFGDGLFQLHENAGRIVVTALAEELSETLCILADREGSLWVGARDLGLIRLRAQRLATVAFGSRGNLDHVRSITEDADGSLWFAGRAGFGHWAGREITLVDTRQLGPQKNSPIFIVPSGPVWTSFPMAGLFEAASAEPGARRLGPAIPFLRAVGEVQAMIARHDGSVWLGTTNGLYRIAGTSNPEKIPGLANSDVRALLEDRDGSLWIGTAAGLDCLKKEGGVVRAGPDSLDNEAVCALYESNDRNLWIGTKSGLRRLREQRLAVLGPDSGVPQESIHSILEDDAGRLWISHASGIARVARRELDEWVLNPSRHPAVAEFGTPDGLLNPEMSGGVQPAALKSRDGRLWFPNRNGLVVVDPAGCPDAPPPQVLIEQLVVDGSAQPAGSRVNLPPGRGQTIEIHFTATSLASPDRVRFRYRLLGHDSSWRDADVVRQARYEGLRPGTYEFRLQARNHEGRWSEREAVIELELAPRFWQTWPFRIVCVLVAAGLMGSLFMSRLRNQRRQLEADRIRSLELERRRIARDMHDHLGAHLAGIALTAGAGGSAHQQVRESLRELNDLIWAVHPDNDTLPSLVDFIANFAARYLAAGGIELDLDLPEQLPAIPLPSPLRHEMAAMFKEALRNVIQHAQAKRVIVRLQLEGNRFTLRIRDDGAGFDLRSLGSTPVGAGSDHSLPSPRSASGNGLRNFHSRCESLGGTCLVTSSPGEGTEVQFSVPLDRAEK